MKTVKVRIAVAVDESGNWHAFGWRYKDNGPREQEIKDAALEGIDGETERVYLVEAELPVPEEQIIQGKVVDSDAA